MLASALNLNEAEGKSLSSAWRKTADAAQRPLIIEPWVHKLSMVRAIVGRERELEDLSRAADAGGVVVVFDAPSGGKNSMAMAVDRLNLQWMAVSSSTSAVTMILAFPG
ncbi:hypothetical protein PV646_37655 [Streptomyces sp. ID05-26A]|nr:hypothetical protein [Streptomyces sp. ID05-26A]